MLHIAIVGAGITGVTTAYELSRRGYGVTVFDRNRYAGMETSFANGGQLSASNAEVWNKTATIIQGIRWMTRRDAPLLVDPKPSWHKYSWMAEFIGQIRNYEASTVETVKLAIAARRHMFEVAEREAIDSDVEKRGILHFYRDKAGFDKATRVNALLRRGGLERSPVTPDEIRAIEPTLSEPRPCTLGRSGPSCSGTWMRPTSRRSSTRSMPPPACRPSVTRRCPKGPRPPFGRTLLRGLPRRRGGRQPGHPWRSALVAIDGGHAEALWASGERLVGERF